jgi:chromosome segregation ATPase
MLEIDKVSKGQISQLKDTSKQLDIQNKSIGNQLEEKKQEIARYQVVLSNKEAEVLDLTQQIQSLKQQHAVEVKKLNDAISADKKVIDGLQKQLDEERKTTAVLKELVASKDAELVQKMSSLIDDQTELENRIAEYQSRILDLGDYSQKLEQQFLSVNSQLEEKIKEITRYQAALSNKEAESQELVQQLRILRDGLSSETKTDVSPLGGVVQLLQ